jgi:hypothetical protein
MDLALRQVAPPHVVYRVRTSPEKRKRHRNGGVLGGSHRGSRSLPLFPVYPVDAIYLANFCCRVPEMEIAIWCLRTPDQLPGSPECSSLAPGPGKSLSLSFTSVSAVRWPSWPAMDGRPVVARGDSSSVTPLCWSLSWCLVIVRLYSRALLLVIRGRFGIDAYTHAIELAARLSRFGGLRIALDQ